MIHLPFSFLRGKPFSPLFFFVWILPSCSMDSPPSSSNDSAQRFSTVLPPPPPSIGSSSLYLVDDSAEKSSPLLSPPSPSLDTTTLSSIDDPTEKSSSVHPALSTDSASSYFSSVDSAEKFSVDFLSSLIAKKSFSSLSSVDDTAEKSSPVLPPPSPSMDSASFSINSAEKLTIDLLSSLVAEKSSSSVLPPPPPPPPSSSSMDSTERLSTRMKKRRNGESVDEVINQWKEFKSSNLSSRGGGDGFKRRTKNLGKTAKRGYMKGKGGPDNLGCKYKGVRQRTFGKWVAEIREPGGGRLVWLGTFNSARDAALAFDKAALAMYGSYAQLNIPEALNSPSEAVNSPSEAVNSPPKELSSGEMSYVDTELRLGFA